MPDNPEVQIARIEERQKSMDEKLDILAMKQGDILKAVEEFHTFKAQVKIWGTVAMLGITFLKDALFKAFGTK